MQKPEPLSAGQLLRQEYPFRVAAALFGLGGLAAGTAAILHWTTGEPHWLDRVLPGALSVWLWVLFFRLWSRPEALMPTVRVGLYSAAVAQVVPAWYFAFAATGAPGQRLVDLLPPIVITLFPVMVAGIAYLSPREARAFACGLWVLVALPLLGYLALNPAELREPGGRQLALALGPVSWMILALIPLFRGVERKIEALEGERSRMQGLAERDALTGLYNRRAGEAWLREAVERHGPGVGVILFDVDRFKQINDRFGHSSGDEVLCEIAARATAAIRRQDVLMRWGGEEFLVLLRGVDAAGLLRVAEDLRLRVRQEAIGSVGVVTASFGVALWRADERIEQTLGRADEALYAAKDAGRDRVLLAE